MNRIPLFAAFALAGLHGLASAQNCSVAEGETLTIASNRVCDGDLVYGLLNNMSGATLTGHGMRVGYPSQFPVGELRTDGEFISRAPYFFNWSKVTVGSTGRFEHRDGEFYSFGAFTNHGEFANSGNAIFGGGGLGRSVLINTGKLVNTRTLNFSADTYFYIDGTTFIPGDNASLVNSGEIYNSSGASLLLDNRYGSLDFTGGRLINDGYFRMRGIALYMGEASQGTLELRVPGTADFDSFGVAPGYLQSNAGTLLIGLDLRVEGILQNDGTLTVHGQASVGCGWFSCQPGLLNKGKLNIGGRDGSTNFAATLFMGDQGYVQNSGQMLIEMDSRLLNRFSWFSNKGELINRGQITNQGGHFELAAGTRFTLDGDLHNTEGGTVIFAAGSVTTGSGHYLQDDGTTWLDGQVDLADFKIAGGRLCGSGYLNGNMVVTSGAVCPGHSPGTLHIGGDVDFLGGTLRLEIAGTTAGLFDVLQVDGALSFAEGVVLDVSFIAGYVPRAGDTWSMLRVGGTTTGLSGLSLRLSGLPAGFALALDGGGQFALQAPPAPTPPPIPEPGTGLLLLAGTVALLGLQRRQVGAKRFG